MTQTKLAWLLAGAGLILALFPWTPAALAHPQEEARDDGERAAATASIEVVATDSPRASLAAYLHLCRTGRYAEAAGYLELPPPLSGRGSLLARRLKAILDRNLWLDLGRISPRPEGTTDDGLSPDTEEIGRIRGAGSTEDPVLLRRRSIPGNARWIFAKATVGRIDGWYQQLQGRWLLDAIPEPLQRPGPGDLLWWQWMALPALFLAAWSAGLTLSRLTRGLLGRLAARTRTTLDDTIAERLGGPITLAGAIAAVYTLLPWLGLFGPAKAAMHTALRAGLFATVFWSLLRSIDVLDRLILQSDWARERPAARTLVPLAGRSAKVLVAALAAVAVLSELGYPVASLIAGLGIGGLALALAAQKTVEHLFGSFSIGVDQPFREGDFVRIDDFVGTVEEIGLRSTRFRTLDRTLITIPNGRLADMRIESFTARDRMRLACTIGLVYGTTAAQMRRVLDGLERALREHPKIWPEAVVVRFKEFASSSLDIEVMAWFQTPDWSEFQLIRQEVLLQFMEVVERAGTSFAFPTRTIHLVTTGGDATERRVVDLDRVSRASAAEPGSI